MTQLFTRIALLMITGFILLLTSACSSIIATQTNKLSNSLSQSVLESEDPQTIAEALPTLIVVSETLIRSNPSASNYLAAGKLYSTFAGTFVTTDAERQQRLASIGYRYSQQGACLSNKTLCDLQKKELSQLQAIELNNENQAVIYQLAVSWLTLIQSHSDDWSIVAQLPKAKALLEKSVKFDPLYEHANGHLYLGAIATLVPPSLGGKPEVGRQHFEAAIELSEGKNLMAKVEFARRYARLMFEQELHHQLLIEVEQAPLKQPGLTLANAIAKQEAKKLLASEADYF